MTLGDLPVGACWVCKGRSKEVGIFVRNYEVFYTQYLSLNKFNGPSRVGDVDILFLPVGLV